MPIEVIYLIFILSNAKIRISEINNKQIKKELRCLSKLKRLYMVSREIDKCSN